MKPRPRGMTYKVMASKEEARTLTEDIIRQKNAVAYSADHHAPSLKPSVHIVSCISFQKFRYSGENRPGKKYQEKDFMTLQLNNLSDKVVRVIIICTDADNRELIHPNGLVGKDCHHGIYDKEYIVPDTCHKIKIPYLRTERIKINSKKEGVKSSVQTNNIQAVLSQRASHLPSPYKERCLSQCTDKYTSARKFDTTKVCLGVIITVQSQGGEYNGSLHAISHMVCNASEKTNLEIYKLSQNDISAWHGGVVDIFTNEEGPAIEPEKCLVYVTLPVVPGAEDWKSDIFSPLKEDILYKKVITYAVPAIAPNFDISSPVTALLHLEFPQSNQYCCAEFKYVPLDSDQVVRDFVWVENVSPTGTATKRSVGDSQEEVKPRKKSKLEFDSPEQAREAIKANLRSKLRARTENGGGDNGELSQSHSETEVVNESGDSVDRPIYNHHQQQHVVIRRDDPQTGEASYLLDMDASKVATNSHVNANVVRSASNSQQASSPYNSQDVKVVAAGYSDAVPPNTTVLIYTTEDNQQVGQVGDDHAILKNSNNTSNNHGYSYDDHNNAMVKHEIQSSVSEELVTQEQMTIEQSASINRPKIVNNQLANSSYGYNINSHNQPKPQYSTAFVESTSNQHIAMSTSFNSPYTTTPSKAASVIPDIHSMVIPQKSLPQTSPWEVSGSEDMDDYRMCVEGMHFQPAPVAPTAVKVEPGNLSDTSSGYGLSTDYAHMQSGISQRSSFNRSTLSGYTVTTCEKPVDENANATGRANVVGGNIGNGTLPSNLDSLFKQTITSNLTTLEVAQFADKLEGLNSVDLETEQSA